MNDKERRQRRRQKWQFVELYPDGTELVRHTGSYAMCHYLLVEFTETGFKGVIRPAPREKA